MFGIVAHHLALIVRTMQELVNNTLSGAIKNVFKLAQRVRVYITLSNSRRFCTHKSKLVKFQKNVSHSGNLTERNTRGRRNGVGRHILTDVVAVVATPSHNITRRFENKRIHKRRSSTI